MTQDRAIDEDFGGPFDLQVADQRVRAMAQARKALAEGPDHPRVLRLMLQAQIADGDDDGAAETAARLARLPDQPDPLDLMIDAALDIGAVQAARCALSTAEAEGTLPAWRISHLKARIALESGDLLAARAILVMAIDAAPENTALRALLAEAMVASGTASDARAVLGHIGRPPVNPPAAATRVGDDGDASAAPRYAPDSTQG